jgi:cytoskeletal protein CcmA (bactofilin family)
MGKSANLSPGVVHSAITGIIEPGCEFEGKLSFLGAVRISGVFRGEIYTPDTLIIGEGARVQGKIQAGTVIISGEVSGEIRARYRVEIQKPAIFRGDIHTPSLRVEDGVIFEGSSKMVRGATLPAPGPSSKPSA